MSDEEQKWHLADLFAELTPSAQLHVFSSKAHLLHVFTKYLHLLHVFTKYLYLLHVFT
jgi:hypothetical protein